MSKKKSPITTEEFDELFDRGDEDILELLDLTTATHTNPKMKRVNVDFPEWMVNSLDTEAKRIGVPRQSLIKLWLAEMIQLKTNKDGDSQS
jgi:hypothetical protein